MSFASWLPERVKSSSRPSRPVLEKTPRRGRKGWCARPCLEGLEDRITPTLFTDFGTAANALTSVQTSIRNALDSGAHLPIIDGQLGDRANVLPTSTISALAAAIGRSTSRSDLQTGIASALGGLLGDTDGDRTPDEPTDVFVSGDLTNSVGIEVHLHQDVGAPIPNLNVNLGLNSLPVRITSSGGAQVTFGFDYELAFGYNINGINGFTIDTGKHLASGHQLDMGVDATLTNFNATATLGFFTATATDIGNNNASDPTQHTEFKATLHLDGLDSRGGTPIVSVDGRADVNLQLNGSVVSADFPSVDTNFQLHWLFDSSHPGANPPTVSFSDVSVDLGQFLGGVLEPILKRIQDATAPFKPILDVVNAPIPGLSDISNFLGQGDVTLLGLADLAASQSGYGALASLVSNAITLVDTIDSLNIGQGAVRIPLGGFDLGGPNQDLTQQPDALDPLTAPSNAPLTQLTIENGLQQIDVSRIDSAIQNSSLPQGVKDSAVNLLTKLTDALTPNFQLSFQFPILENPAQGVFQMLLGQDPVLVSLTTQMHFDADPGKADGLSFDGVGLSFDANLDARAKLTFNYDTFGLREAVKDVAAGHLGNIASDIADGFYVTADSFLSVSGGIFATAGASFGIVSVGIRGGINTGNNGQQPITIGLSDPGNGKVRIGDLEAGRSHFTFQGEFDATLALHVEIGVHVPIVGFVGFAHDFGIAGDVLLDFNHLAQPQLTVLGSGDRIGNTPEFSAAAENGVVTLYTGSLHSQRKVYDITGLHEQTQDETDGNENYTISHIGDDADGETIKISAFGVSQIIHDVRSISGAGDVGTYTVDVQPGVTSSVNLAGGAGSAFLTYAGAGSAILRSGRQDSTLIGGFGSNYLYAGPGNDHLVPGHGSNQISTGNGNDTIVIEAPTSSSPVIIGSGNPNATNTLEVLGLPSCQSIQVSGFYDSGGIGIRVLATSASRNMAFFAFPSAHITNLVLGGEGATRISVGSEFADLALTSLRTITVGASPAIPQSAGSGYVGEYALNLLRGNFVTVFGSPTNSDFEMSSSVDTTQAVTQTVTRVDVISNPTGQNTHLVVKIVGMTSDDALDLTGEGANDMFKLDMNPLLTFATTVESDRFSANNTLLINAMAIPGGSISADDDTATFAWLVHEGNISFPWNDSIYYDQNITDFQILFEPSPEAITVNRSFGTTELYTDQQSNLSGNASYDLSGLTSYDVTTGYGNITYTIHWPTGQVRINKLGTGTDSLIVDDSNYVSVFGSQYSIMPVGNDEVVSRRDEGRVWFGNISEFLGFDQSIVFTNIPNVTLDTGHGITHANTVDLYSMPFGTHETVNTEDGQNNVHVQSTAPGTTTTINSGTGTDQVTIGYGTNSLDPIVGAVAVNGNGATNVSVIDLQPYNFLPLGPATYQFTNDQLDRTSIESNGLNAVAPQAVITYSNLGGLGLQTMVTSPVNFINVLSTIGAATLSLNPGNNFNAITVGDANTNLDGIGNLIVNGGLATTLRLDDEANADRILNLQPFWILAHPVSTTYQTSNQVITRTNVETNSLLGVVYLSTSTYSSTITYHGIARPEIDGGATGNVFNLQGNGLNAVIQGGSGVNTLVGPNGAEWWTISGANAGSIVGISGPVYTVSFSGMANLTGGTAPDTFQFSNGAGVTGIIDGGTGVNSNTLDYSAYTTPVVVSLGDKSATGTGGFANIQSFIGGSGGIAIRKSTPVVTWNNPADITLGTPLSGAQLDATTPVAGSFIYTPAAGTVLPGGEQTLSVTFIPTDTADFNTVTVTTQIDVVKATPTVIWAAPAPIVYGTALSATQLDATASVAGSFVYTPALGVILHAGQLQPLSVTFTPTDTTDYATVTVITHISVGIATPVLSWITPGDITVGTALSPTQLDATTPVPGTFVYTPPIGTILGSGQNQALHVTFTPTDTADYTTVTAFTFINVVRSAVPITWPTPADITFGTVLSASQLDASASVPGTFTYIPALGTMLRGGPQTLTAFFTPTDTTSYSSTMVSVQLNVIPANAALNWSPAPIIYGMPLTAAQLNATSPWSGTFTYSQPTGTVLGGGPQTLSVTFTPTDTQDIASGTLSVTLMVNPATPTLTWDTPADILAGTPLSATQLDATASVPGTFLYKPDVGAVLGVGNQPLSVFFTPFDTTDYTGASATVWLNVVRETPTITWPTPEDIPFGTPLSATQLDATASVPGTFDYGGAFGAILPGGQQTLFALFTPDDTTAYTQALGEVQINVTPADSMLSWAQPADITYGTPLSAAQLDASSQWSGTFTYTPAIGTVLGGGAHTLSVSFVPDDPTDIAPGTMSVTIMVNPAIPTLMWTTPADISFGTGLSAAQLDATSSVPGSFVYDPPIGTPLSAGQHTLTVLFVPTDNASYAPAATSVQLNVTPANPMINWSQPDDIGFGTPLSANQLNATSPWSGTFTYSPPLGTVLDVGAHTLSVAFLPADSADVAPATFTVTIMVQPPTATLWVDVHGQAVFSSSAGIGGNLTLGIRDGNYVFTDSAESILVAGPGASLCSGSGANAVTCPTSFLAAIALEPAGLTNLLIDDSGDTAARNVNISYDGTFDTLAGLLPASIDWIPGGAFNSGVNQVSITGGSGATVFSVDSTGPGTPVIINTGSGQNQVIVGDAANQLDSIQGPLTVNGGYGGVTSLVVDDQGSTSQESYEVFAGEVDRTHLPDAQGNYVPDMAPISYTGLSSLALYASTSSYNLLYIEGTAAGTTTDVYGGRDNSTPSQFTVDEFVVSGGPGDTLDDILGPLNLHGRTGNQGESIMSLNDASTVGGRTYTLSANSISRTAMAPITFDGLVQNVLYTSENAVATINVQSTAANMATYVVAGAGDPVTVGQLDPITGGSTLAAIQGPLIIDSGYLDQIPFVTIDDSGDPTDHPQASISSAAPYYDYQLTGLAPAPIIFGLYPATPLTIKGGTGANTLSVTLPGDFAANWTLAGFANFSMAVEGNLSGQIRVAGALGTLAVGGNLTGTVSATTIGSVTTGQNLTGQVSASQSIGVVSAGGIITGNVSAPVIQQATVNGAVGNDQMEITPTRMTLNGVVILSGTFGALFISGRGGNDFIKVTGGAVPAWITTGAGDDVFQFDTGAGITGTLDGGGGTNTLDYSQYVGDILVDLPLGIATGVGRSITHIEDVVGSQGNELLVGDANVNVFSGGTGRSILIGGRGADQLLGGSHDNLLIGGYTSYDLNLVALQALMKEWTSADSYAARVKAIGNGVIGSDGNRYALVGGKGKAATVFDDGALDFLTGTLNPDPNALDWLFGGAADSILNAKKKDTTSQIF